MIRVTHEKTGNLLSDGRFNYKWDCENRLIGAETLTNLPASVPLINASYSYDYMSRRSRKIVDSTTNTFVYDSWNLIREVAVTLTNTVTNSYVWGLDLSGSVQGAGGVGGLLCVIRNGTPYYPCYDANGNISDYVDTNGVVIAHREYDPFGNTIVATGSMVNDFSFWFSTKYLDQETGLYYYGYRYYSPSLGRWLSRDPLGEKGFNVYRRYKANNAYGDQNSYLFIRNRPVSGIDYLGLTDEGGSCKPEEDKCDIKKLEITATIDGKVITTSADVQATGCKDGNYNWVSCHWGGADAYEGQNPLSHEYDPNQGGTSDSNVMLARYRWLACKESKDPKKKGCYTWQKDSKDSNTLGFRFNGSTGQWEPFGSY